MGYVVYYRVSTKKQGESGLGLDAQKRDINVFFDNYAKGENPVAEFTDVQSGSVDSRKGLQAAITLCKEKGHTLLVAKLDRVSRKVSTIALLMEEVELKVACMPHADNFQLHIFAALAEQERLFISQRTKAAMAEASARGVKIGGAAIRAKQTRRKTYEKLINRDSEHTKILKAFKEKKLSLREIASRFNDMNIKTPKGCIQTAASIQRMCKRLEIV